MTKMSEKQRDIQQRIENILADNEMFQAEFIIAESIYDVKFKYHSKFDYDPQSNTWNSAERWRPVTDDQIRQCLKFLLVSKLTNRKILKFDFYYLKHQVEKWGRDAGDVMVQSKLEF